MPPERDVETVSGSWRHAEVRLEITISTCPGGRTRKPNNIAIKIRRSYYQRAVAAKSLRSVVGGVRLLLRIRTQGYLWLELVAQSLATIIWNSRASQAFLRRMVGSNSLRTGQQLHSRREHPRHKVFHVAEVRSGNESLRVHLLDVSLGGTRLHSTSRLDVGHRVILTLLGEPRCARVVWRSGARYGLCFNLPLTEEQMAALLPRAIA